MNKLFYYRLSDQIDTRVMLECLNLSYDDCTRSRSSLCAEIIVRALVSTDAPSTGPMLTLNRSPHGKPYFECLPRTHFNISHSKDWIVIGIADAELGIDIETMRCVTEKLIARCLSTGEIASLSKNPQIRTREFLQLWTQKEAYLKYCGCGITGNEARLEVTDQRIAANLYSFMLDEAYVSVYYEADSPKSFSQIELHDSDLMRMMA